MLKRRLLKRLEFHGIEFALGSVREEEFCYIPMGGAMPTIPQRVVGFGGAAGLVHPATGYMISRTMNLAGHICRVQGLGFRMHEPRSYDPRVLTTQDR